MSASNTTLKSASFVSIVKGNKTLTVERVVGGKTHITTTVDVSSFPNPTTKEGKPAVVIPHDFFMEGCEIWRFSLIGRIIFKGVDFNDIKTSLEEQWKLGEGRVQFVPLNRGFFIIKLLSQEDKDRVFTEEGWMVKQQKLRFIEWYPGFDVNKPPSSRANVWVRFPGLPIELWVEKTLLSLGNPIVVDSRTLNHEYGHFASVLIDIDFATHDADEIHVAVDGRNFLKKKRVKQQARGPPKPPWQQVRDKNKEVDDVKAIPNDHVKEAAVVNDWKEVRHKKHGASGSVVIPIVAASVDNNASLTSPVNELVHRNKFYGLDNDTSGVLLETEEEKELDVEKQQSVLKPNSSLARKSVSMEKSKPTVLDENSVNSKPNTELNDMSVSGYKHGSHADHANNVKKFIASENSKQ
ncbi:uncharacterized protein LOC113342258 [Papaver somniferum]|uniref:uncharacterized protein LOC113342258 n=1 Tax=Papaver somniferum TaxID=3469 RepID=UPI000E6FDEB7|nr:uncharacterized protein LOC113342258 [Papaver somniferum]